MRKFNVFHGEDGTYKAVKQGWCWPAFFFGSIWALFSGLWLAAFLILPIDFVFSIAGSTANVALDRYDYYDETMRLAVLAVFSIPLAIRVMLGIFGNTWRARRLGRLGFSHVARVKADGKQHAISLSKTEISSSASEGQHMQAVAGGAATPKAPIEIEQIIANANPSLAQDIGRWIEQTLNQLGFAKTMQNAPAVSDAGLAWLWAGSAAVLFLVLMSAGNHVAAMLIAVSGLIAAPSLTSMFHRYGANQKARTKIGIGSAALSCITIILFSYPKEPIDKSVKNENHQEEFSASSPDETISHMEGQSSLDINQQSPVAFAPAPQVIMGCLASDGDTLNCGGERIRLLGINAPEMPGHCRLGMECVEGDPLISKKSLQSSISFNMSIVRIGMDHYNRTLGLVYSNGQNLSCVQLSRGVAIYKPDWDNDSRVANECSSGQF